MNLARLLWLRPSTNSFAEMKQIADYALDQLSMKVLVMMFHSSELYPGASPYNQTEQDVGFFVKRLEQIFYYLVNERGLIGITLSQFARLASTCGSGYPHKEI